MAGCKPLGFLIGLPFAIVSLLLSLLGAVIWVLGSVLSCLCPCFTCFVVVADLAMFLMKLPVKIIEWFVDMFPC